MLRVERHADPTSVPSDTLRLGYDDRKKSRLRVWSEHRREVGIFLAWGSTLRDGDLLAAKSGEVLLVKAAPEPLSEVRTRDWHLLTRAAYHLGNRHVPLQIEPGILRYQRDHVLDEMLGQMGLHVDAVEAPFEPEAGAYAGGGHSHGHGGEDAHAHGQGGEDAHGHGHGHGQGGEDAHGHGHEDAHGHVHGQGGEDAQGDAHEDEDEHAHMHFSDNEPTAPGGDSDTNLQHLLHRSRNS